MKPNRQMLTKLDRKESQVSLFDRLCWNEYQELETDLDAYKASIQRELEIILNTRPTALNWNFSDQSEEMVRRLPEYFGLHDFILEQASNNLGRLKVAQEIKTVIELYEPRLKNVTVKFNVKLIQNSSVFIEITGDIFYQNTVERAAFRLRVFNLFQNKV
ncbi:MAG: type VI secretion system baseplate subunit TssE [Janthinobacterium lividum]